MIQQPSFDRAAGKQLTSPRSCGPANSQSRRIVLLIGSLRTFGGVEAIALRLLRALIQMEVEAKLVVAFREGEQHIVARDLEDYVEYLSGPRPVENQSVERKLRSLSMLSGIRRKLERLVNPQDILMVCNMRHPVLNLLTLRRPNPRLGWIHCSVTDYGHRLSESLNALTFGQYDRILTCSAENRSIFADKYPKLGGRTRWIHNGVDHEEVRRAKDRPIDAPGSFFLFAGQLIHRKGVDVLLDAFSEFCRRNSTHHLVLLGEGEEREALEQRAAEHRIHDRVHFRGFEANVYSWMARSEAFILPSRCEGLPLVLVEAMATGAPVIASDTGTGAREVLDYGRRGILFALEDRAALRDAMIMLATERELRRSYRQHSLERAQDFTMQSMADELLARVDELSPEGRTITTSAEETVWGWRAGSKA